MLFSFKFLSRNYDSPFYFLSTIVLQTQDGMWGLTYEHSAGEAPAVFKAFEEITEKVDSMSPPDENLVASHLPAPEKLEWCLTEQSLNDIREAMMNFDA